MTKSCRVELRLLARTGFCSAMTKMTMKQSILSNTNERQVNVSISRNQTVRFVQLSSHSFY